MIFFCTKVEKQDKQDDYVVTLHTKQQVFQTLFFQSQNQRQWQEDKLSLKKYNKMMATFFY